MMKLTLLMYKSEWDSILVCAGYIMYKYTINTNDILLLLESDQTQAIEVNITKSNSSQIMWIIVVRESI